MNPDEVPAVLDVHPPHHPPNGARDFFLHLFTITIGLLIALSLEGLVEWRHHKHLAHDAEMSLHREIADNQKDLPAQLDELHKTQKTLAEDVALLRQALPTGKLPKDGHLEIGFHIEGFNTVAWKTAQITGALAYMPYDMAQQYSDIYAAQDELSSSEEVATRDTVMALRSLINSSDKKDLKMSSAEIKDLIKDIETLQGQLLMVDSFMKGVDAEQKKFLTAHPD